MIHLPGAPEFTQFLNEHYKDRVFVRTNGEDNACTLVDRQHRVFCWDVWIKDVFPKIGSYETVYLNPGRDDFTRKDYPRTYDGLLPEMTDGEVHLLWHNKILQAKVLRGVLIPSTATVDWQRMDNHKEIPFP